MKKEDIYIDLSKCTEEEIKSLPQILKKAGEKLSTNFQRCVDKEFEYLKFRFDNGINAWCASGFKGNRTELSYPEFIKLFEGVREKSVEEILSDIDYWSTKYEFNFQFWGDSNNNLFITKGGVRMYDNGGLETPKEAILDALKYISRVNPLNSNQ